jgi:hypothetical protein
MTTQQAVQDATDTKPGVLRDMRIYCTANGPNGGFATHVYTYRVEDENDALIFTNGAMPPNLVDASQALGFHACLLDWLQRLPDVVVGRLQADTASGIKREPVEIVEELAAPRTLTIVTTHVDGTYEVYTHSVEELVASRMKRKGGELWSNYGCVLEVLLEAEANSVTIKCREPESVHEDATLGLVRNEGRRRYHKAKLAAVA